MTIRVIKVGGSLFDLPDLAERLRSLLSRLSLATNVLVAGGGALADAIEQAQRRHDINDEAAHWLCISTLNTSAAWLHAILPEASLTEDAGVVLTAAAPSNWILQVERLLRSPLSGDAIRQLPHDWSVTTDSIAAAVAVELGAEELLLVKSADFSPPPNPPRLCCLAEAAQQGIVDGYFPTAAAGIGKLRWINLRSDASEVFELP